MNASVFQKDPHFKVLGKPVIYDFAIMFPLNLLFS